MEDDEENTSLIENHPWSRLRAWWQERFSDVNVGEDEVPLSTTASTRAAVESLLFILVGNEWILGLVLLMVVIYTWSKNSSFRWMARSWMRLHQIFAWVQKHFGGNEEEESATTSAMASGGTPRWSNQDRRALPKQSSQRSSSRTTTVAPLPMNRRVSDNETDFVLYEDETEHDVFVRNWNSIRTSSYRTLVLPPECRLVQPKWRRRLLSNTDNNSQSNYQQLQFFRIFSEWISSFQKMVLFFRELGSVGEIKSICMRFLNALRFRRDTIFGRPHDDDDEDDEEEDDSSSRASYSSKSSWRSLNSGIFSSSSAAPTPPPPRQIASKSIKPPPPPKLELNPTEEKKDGPENNLVFEWNTDTDSTTDTIDSPSEQSSLDTNQSSFVSSLPNSVPDNILLSSTIRIKHSAPSTPNNVSSYPSPMPPPRQLNRKRDALESYRRLPTQATHAPPPPPPPIPPPSAVGISSTLQPPTAPHGTVKRNLSSQQQRHNHAPQSISSQTPTTAPPPQDLKFFDAANSAAVLKKMVREVPVPDRNGYILGDEFLDTPSDKMTPLLVFVNSRSGPQQGHVLIAQLRRLLNPIQVWDLALGNPEPVLQSFMVLKHLRILVCGGDGTVSWILSALESLTRQQRHNSHNSRNIHNNNTKEISRWPPVAILPLGTGNDLARIHGWGAGYTNESLLQILEQLSEAYVSLLDRWELCIVDGKDETKVRETKTFTNYLGVGVDAQAALQVHMLRESKPKLFFSRAVNKAWYAMAGAEDAIKESCAGLPEHIVLEADGVEIPLPPDSQGIIFLNIDSYSGGVPLWTNAMILDESEPNDSQSCLRTSRRQRKFVDDPAMTTRRCQASLRRRRLASIDRTDSIDDFDCDEGIRKDIAFPEEKLARTIACDGPSSCQDGLLDVVSVRGTFHLGQIRVGLSHAQRLCQCREATVRWSPTNKNKKKRAMAVQIDGEPWRQKPAVLKIRRKVDPAIMLHRAADEGGGVETEMAQLLEWAEERGVIDRTVHQTLMKEFSRRIENKTRERRVKSQDNLLLRAMGKKKKSF